MKKLVPPNTTALLDLAAAGHNLQRITYPCGCEGLGKAPMPAECPTHGAPKVAPERIVHVGIVLDESGSMASCCQQTIDGINEYVAGLANQPQAYRITLTKFDLSDGPTCRVLYKDMSPTFADKLTKENYKPGGSTPMYDAIGQTVTAMQGTVPAGDKALVVIMTDGEENASKEWNKDSVKKLIAECEAKGNWTFVYMGANQDAWGEAAAIGISRGNAVNYNTGQIKVAASYLRGQTVRYAASPVMASASFFGGDRHVPDDAEITPLTPDKLGAMGGHARQAGLTKKQRKTLATAGAAARWSGNKV